VGKTRKPLNTLESEELVIKLHDLLITKFGGLHGIRDTNLLKAALHDHSRVWQMELNFIRQSLIKLALSLKHLLNTIHLLMEINELQLLRPLYFLKIMDYIGNTQMTRSSILQCRSSKKNQPPIKSVKGFRATSSKEVENDTT